MQIIEVSSDRVNIGDIGFSQENNDAQLHIELPEKLLGFNSYDVEFELEKGDKSVLKNVEVRDNIIIVPLYQNVLEFGKLYFQIVAYNFDIDQKSKSNLYFGHVQRSINATETIEIVPEVVDQIYKEILTLKEEISSIDGMDEEEVYDLIKKYLKENPIEGILSKDEKEDFIENTEARHTHENKELLDEISIGLHGNLEVDGWPYWSNKNGNVIESITVDETTGDITIRERIVPNKAIPLLETKIKQHYKTSELENDSGFITLEDIPDNGLTQEQAEQLETNTKARHEHENKDILDTITEDTLAEEVPAVYELPTNAKDGDVCLYAPKNNFISVGGNRVYFDWEELVKSIDDSEDTDFNLIIYDTINENEIVAEAVINRFSEGYNLWIMAVSSDGKRCNDLVVTISNGVLDAEGSTLSIINENGETISSTSFHSIDELPLYFDIPKSNPRAHESLYGDAYLFHTDYRLMKYQGGLWSEVAEKGITKSEMTEYVTAAINGSLDEIETMIDESGVLDE